MQTNDTSLSLSETKTAENTQPDVSLPIKAVEKETGISKELLRMWERRYGFPTPHRDERNDRMYPIDQVERLRLIRRLTDAGFRPGKVVKLETSELNALLATHKPKYSQSVKLPKNLQKELLKMLRSRNPLTISEYLNHQLVRIGLEEFILTLMQHTNTFVGDAWMRGDIEIFEEHLYTEQVTNLLRTAISSLKAGTSKPRIMLTTAPEELHNLGLLMVESLLRIDEVDAVNYGSQMPAREVRRAAARHDVDIVLLSFSGAYPTNRAIDFLEELRLALPAKLEIWAGGSSLLHTRKKIDGVVIMRELNDVRNRVLFWKRQHGQLVN